MTDLIAATSWDDPENPQTEWDDAWSKWETYNSDNFMYIVQQGRKGLNIGLPNGLPQLSKYTYGIHRGRYYLFGADSGVGKTTLSDYQLI